ETARANFASRSYELLGPFPRTAHRREPGDFWAVGFQRQTRASAVLNRAGVRLLALDVSFSALSDDPNLALFPGDGHSAPIDSIKQIAPNRVLRPVSAR